MSQMPSPSDFLNNGAGNTLPAKLDIDRLMGTGFTTGLPVSMEIQRLLIMEVPNNVAKPVIRPLTLNVDETVEDELAVEYTRTRGRLTPRSFSRTLQGVSSLVSRHHGTPAIENGWGEQRCTVSMAVLIQKERGSDEMVIFTGYTNRDIDLSYSGTPDPKTLIIFNDYRVIEMPSTSAALDSPLRLLRLRTQDPVIIQPNRVELTGAPVHTLRPTDMLAGVLADHMQNMLTDVGQVSGVDDVSLVRSATAEPRTSAIAGDWLANTITPYQQALAAGGQTLDIYGTASSDAERVRLRTNPFIAKLMEYRKQARATLSFTLAEIYQYDPALLNRTDTRMQVSTLGAATVMAHDPMDGADPDTILATMVVHTAMARAIQNGFYETELLINRRKRRANMNDQWIGVRNPLTLFDDPIFGYDVTDDQLVSDLEMALEGDLESVVPEGYIMSINLRCSGISEITVTNDNGYESAFAVPTFADGLFTPLVSASATHIADLTENTDRLCSTIGQLRQDSLLPKMR